MYRIGQGFDLHRLVEKRKFILGGAEIDYKLGLLGHSDADCLCHSIIDSLLGALALGDIGGLFPDTDPKYKDISSIYLLKEVYNLIKKEGYIIVNLDNTILAQEPKMQHYIPLMRKNLAQVLEIDISQISIKAKTMEEQDSIGQKQALATQSIVFLEKVNF